MEHTIATRTDGPTASGDRIFSKDFNLALLSNALAFGSFYLLLATLPLFVKHLGGSDTGVGVVMGSFAVTAVILRPFVGRYSDVSGRKRLMIWGALLLVVVSLLYGRATGVGWLILLRSAYGVGWAAFGTSAWAMASDIAPARRRGEAMGYFGIAMNLSMAVGPAAGVLLVQRWGYGALFWAAAALAGAAALASLGVSSDHVTRSSRAAAPAGTRAVLLRSALFPSAVLICMALTYASVITFLPVYADVRGLGNPGIFFSVYAVFLIVSRGPLGKASDRFGRGQVVAPGMAMIAASMLLLAWVSTFAGMLVVAALYGLGVGAVQPVLMAWTVDRARSSERGAAMGTFTAAMDVGVGLGSLTWGIVADSAGFGAVYVGSAAVGMVGLVMLVAGGGLRSAAVGPIHSLRGDGGVADGVAASAVSRTR